MSDSKQSNSNQQNSSPSSAAPSPADARTEGEAEERGFKVIDRRKVARDQDSASEAAAHTGPGAQDAKAQDSKGVGSSGSAASGAAPVASSEQAQARSESAGDSQAGSKYAGSDSRSRPPVDFSTLLLSFASTALIQLGAAPHPDTGETQASPEMARETIDILVMLREKTRGNLSEEESRLFDALLHDLRMKFVSMGSGNKA